MNAVETTRAALAAIEACDWARARSYLADDFTFSGAVPQPLGPDAWLGIHQGLAAAIPDFSFNAQDLHEESGKVVGVVQITGTQTRDLALPVPGLAAIPPTGKRVSLTIEPIAVTLRGDKLVNLEITPVAGGGLPGILSQLGVAMPVHS